MKDIFNEGEERETTKETTRYMRKPSNKGWLWAILAVAVVIVVAVVAYLFLSEPSIKLKKGAQLKIEDMKKMAAKVDKIEQKIREKQNEVFELLRTAKQQGVEIPPEIYQSMELGPDEIKALESKLEKEEDVSYKGLLKDIVEKEKEINSLKEELTTLEKKLPRPVVVKKGDTHRDIAINFLTQEYNLPVEKAKKLVEKVNTFDYLIPGFKVWNFYDPEADVFGTFVTQGAAPISPNQIKRRKKQELITAKEKAEARAKELEVAKKTLEEQVAELEAKKKALQEDVSMLRQERDKLTRELAALSAKVADLESKMNSVWYVVGTKGVLKSQGIIKTGFLTSTKIKELDQSLFNNRLDLRTSTTIVINATDFGLKKIKDATVLPKEVFKKKVDYEVVFSPDKAQAQIQILNPNKFKNNKVVIIIK
ncbi:MAG: hypothetical protein J7L62_02875 [Candidatus Aminicenantes bacterium]|nr:hypothetical protein [Candidatus Aminicenantes bacterium]